MSRKMLNHDGKKIGDTRAQFTIIATRDIEYAERTTASAVDITEHGAYFA
jgi:hypothetical protein